MTVQLPKTLTFLFFPDLLHKASDLDILCPLLTRGRGRPTAFWDWKMKTLAWSPEKEKQPGQGDSQEENSSSHRPQQCYMKSHLCRLLLCKSSETRFSISFGFATAVGPVPHFCVFTLLFFPIFRLNHNQGLLRRTACEQE